MPTAAQMDPNPGEQGTLEVQRRVIVHLVRELGGAATVPALGMADENTKLNVTRSGTGDLLLTITEPAHVHLLIAREDGTWGCSACDGHWQLVDVEAP